MKEYINSILTIISIMVAIWQAIRANNYKIKYEKATVSNSTAGRDVNNAGGDININNGN